MKLPLWARNASLAVAFSAMSALSSTSLLAQQTPPPAAGAPTDIEVGGITKPSVHSKLALPQFGQVLELPVKEGDVVKKDQVILRQDDRQEVAALEALRLEAESTVRVEAADADLKIKQVQHKRLQDLAVNGNANPTEVEEAWVKVVYADAQAKIARLENQKNKYEFQRQDVKVKLMSLRSPIDGVVETIDTSVGEVTDPQKPVMTVVRNDPLWVEFFLPTMQSSKLKVGQQLEVRYPAEEKWHPAKVIYKAPVADAASDTQKMRLEMPNASMTDTGLQVLVRLPANVGPAQQPTATSSLNGPGGSSPAAVLAGPGLPASPAAAASAINAR
jgi:RND family efflux transporter MFP subunit